MARSIVIETFIQTDADTVMIDVRSPAEYEHGHIPGALNLPLFSNEERHEVGLLYAQQGQREALKRGLELVGPKMRTFVEWAERHAPSGKVNIYCWRGGMRSASIAWLLETAGFTVATLQRGYKSYRRFALQLFEQPLNLIVLGGNTGAGKTKILHELESMGESVVDLEALAGHKGSAFGWLGEERQPTQEQFENDLAWQLFQRRDSARIWVEDESRRIGRVNQPLAFWNLFLASTLIYVEMSRALRVENLVNDYGAFPAHELLESLTRIKGRLGPERFRTAVDALEAGNMAVVADVCLEYYDVYYQRGLLLRDRARIVECVTSDRQAAFNAELVRSRTASAGEVKKSLDDSQHLAPSLDL